MGADDDKCAGGKRNRHQEDTMAWQWAAPLPRRHGLGHVLRAAQHSFEIRLGLDKARRVPRGRATGDEEHSEGVAEHGHGRAEADRVFGW